MYRLVGFTSPEKKDADILWASSQTIRSQSDCSSLAWSVSSRLSLSRRQITREFSWNQLPVRADSSLSFVMISNGKWKRRSSSSCHCSARLPGQTIMQRCRSPRTISSLMSSPVMMVLPDAGVVGQQVAEGLAGQHLAVDGRYLVRQRLDHRSVDGQQRDRRGRPAGFAGPRIPAGKAHHRHRNSKGCPRRRFRWRIRGRGTEARSPAVPRRLCR